MSKICSMLVMLSLMISGSYAYNPFLCKENVPDTERVYEQNGHFYEMSDDNKNYSIESVEGELTNDSNTYGKFCLKGDITPTESLNGIQVYEVESGTVKICYEYNDLMLTADNSSWHLINDSTKKVNGTDTGKIGKGVIYLQTSFDGVNWVVVPDDIKCNVFSDKPNESEPFKTTNDIQQINGTYFRLVVAYKVERTVSDGWLMFDEKETEKRCEIYEFYVVDKQAETYDNSGLSMVMGEVVETVKDNGFDENDTVSITKNDPHYGWNLGYFTLSGYTQKQPNTSDNIFLKNEGDRIQLAFHLEQDIDNLPGEKKAIYSDSNGYDTYFQSDVSGRGTLIIRFTDSNGNKSAPQVYNNFLLANTMTGADTRVQLFEEGDYEVALDYEIKTGATKYTNYRISFNFSVRNGNCMAFPMDSASKSEIDNLSITPNGFYIDWARSRYLSIQVERKVLNSTRTGLDTRFNRPTYDGEIYTDEGIYFITVTNVYTMSSNEIVICVGSDRELIGYFKSEIIG